MISVMISVPLLSDQPLHRDDKAVLVEFCRMMQYQDWAKFLVEHQTHIEKYSRYNPRDMLYEWLINFYLPPEQETMYHLRFD